MTALTEATRDESRWPPALTILAVLGLMAVLPHHITVMPVWVSHVAALAVLVPMVAVALTRANVVWLRIERTMIMFFAAAYIANTAAELADMIGIITLHPPETRADLVALLIACNLGVQCFDLLIALLANRSWRPNRSRRAGATTKPDWLFPQAAAPEESHHPTGGHCSSTICSLGYNTATAFSPTDVLPLTRRAKMLMMLESTISLLTLVIVAARAVNVLP